MKDQTPSAYLEPILCALLASILAAITGHAQFHAGIQGTVTDPSGAAAPGATVIVTNKGTPT